MRFADISYNDAAVEALRQMVDGGRIPHAMLLREDPGCGALALASAFVQYLMCENRQDGDSCGRCPSCLQVSKLVHPDVHYVFPVNTGDVIKGDHPVSEMGVAAFRELFLSNPYFSEQELYEALGIDSKSGNISVAEARSIISKLSLSSLAGGYKVVVIFLAERLNPQAANKLLKILEEAPEKTVFILTTNNPEDVLGTVFSRCQFLRVLPPPQRGRGGDVASILGSASEEISAIWERLIDAVASRDLQGALQQADAVDALKSREKQKAFCNFASWKIRDMFLVSKNLGDIASGAPARSASSKFCLRSAAALDEAAMLLGRNALAKTVFTDLVNRMYVNW